MNTIPTTILAQLGGRQFIAYTGAKDFIATMDDAGISVRPNEGGNTLVFKIGRNFRMINLIQITLLPSDCYRMKFCRLRKGEISVVSDHKEVYCDQLCELFTEETGMYIIPVEFA